MKLLLGVVLAVVMAGSAGAQPAFPGAMGFGAEARGGRGGRMIEVTNLNDDGPGSLRAAVEATGPRIVVFRTLGYIQLQSDLKIEHPFITIAGQTAPGFGITLMNHPLVVGADDVIVRYIRSRLGTAAHVEADAISITRGHNIILDHVSASWSVDETLSVAQHEAPGPPTLDNVTVQWSIIAQSLDNSIHSKGPHGYGSLIRGANGARYSFIDNLWAHHHARMPRPGNYLPIAQDPLGPLVDFRNNVFYNWGGNYSGYDADQNAAVRYNFVGNYYQAGPNSGANSVAFREQNAGAKAYFGGNWFNGSEPADPWSVVWLDAVNPDYRQAAAFDAGQVTTAPANVAYENVLARAGAQRTDLIDASIVRSVREKNGALINSEFDAGGLPIPVGLDPDYSDHDHDGMGDAWERAHGLDPRNAADGAADRDGDGYTNVEEFLNSLSSP